MNGRTLWIIVLIIIVAIGAWFVFTSNGTSTGGPASPAATNDMTASTSPTGAMAPAPVMVTYTDQGFSPASVTVNQGQAVMWMNQSSGQMWIASNPHPTHTGYDGTNSATHCAAGYTGSAPLDECVAVPAGGSFTFTFNQAGSWGYHNHMDHGMTGTVVVTANSMTGTSSPNVY